MTYSFAMLGAAQHGGSLASSDPWTNPGLALYSPGTPTVAQPSNYYIGPDGMPVIQYTAQVAGADNGSGVALVEVYEVP